MKYHNIKMIAVLCMGFTTSVIAVTPNNPSSNADQAAINTLQQQIQSVSAQLHQALQTQQAETQKSMTALQQQVQAQIVHLQTEMQQMQVQLTNEIKQVQAEMVAGSAAPKPAAAIPVK